MGDGMWGLAVAILGGMVLIMAVAIGIVIGTVGPLLLEYFGIIDYVKNWP